MVNDFFGLSTRYLRYNRSIFFKCTQLESFVTIVLNAVALDTLDAANEYSRFLKELL